MGQQKNLVQKRTLLQKKFRDQMAKERNFPQDDPKLSG